MNILNGARGGAEHIARCQRDRRQVRIILTSKDHNLKEQGSEAQHSPVCASVRSAQEIQARKDDLIHLRGSLDSVPELSSLSYTGRIHHCCAKAVEWEPWL